MNSGGIDREKVSLNLARLKKGGETFEVIIEPDNIIAYKKGKLDDIKDILRYDKVFVDAKKGLSASEERMKAIFNTDRTIEVCKIILDEGEIQFTQEYRNLLRTEKLNKILGIICRNAIDPRTHLPHPRTRIENAFEEAKIKVDELLDAEDQVQEIIVKLRPILPIKFAKKEILVTIPAQYAAKAYGTVQNFATIKKDQWLNDGSWLATVEIPAGLQTDFFDSLNKLTHGEMESEVLSEK